MQSRNNDAQRYRSPRQTNFIVVTLYCDLPQMR